VTGGQIAALIFALLLLLPGGCFVILGFGMMSESTDFGTMLLVIGLAILSVMGLLFWLAFRKPPPPPDAGAGPSVAS
jgi:membrane protein implicated in regulation of membrane protease activity